jgi:hypothetical protein
MAGTKKTIKDISLGRDKEIRVRYVKKEDLQALSECSRILGEKSIPGTVIKLIHNYKGDQSLIKQLQARNNQLNAALLDMVKDRGYVEKLLREFLKRTQELNGKAVTVTQRLLKDFSKRGTKKSRPTR